MNESFHSIVPRPDPFVLRPDPFVPRPHPFVLRPDPFVLRPHPFVLRPHPFVLRYRRTRLTRSAGTTVAGPPSALRYLRANGGLRCAVAIPPVRPEVSKDSWNNE
jgi:hypothetical protein